MSAENERLGQRIREAREALGLNQEELSSRVGFASRQILSEVERGQREVKARELVAIARALRSDIGAFLSDIQPARPAVLWRDRPADRAEDVQAEFLTWCSRYSHVLAATGASHATRTPLPSMDVDPNRVGYRDAEELASEVSRMLGLGSRPAASLQRSLETQFDIIVWFLDLGEDGSAACAKGEFGAAMLVNQSEPPWRRHFDMAHELFHLVTWDSMSQAIGENTEVATRAEQVANAFAAALLLPSVEVKGELEARCPSGQLSKADLVAVARDFDVSTDALLWRLLNMGLGLKPSDVKVLLNDPDLRQIDKASKAGKWWCPSPLPERFVRLSYLAVTHGRLSRSKLASYLECGLGDLKVCLEEYGISEESNGEGISIDWPATEEIDTGAADGQADMCLA